MEFTLEYRLEVGLHTLSCYFYYITDALFASYRHFVDVRSYQCDLVIFDLRCILCHNQLAAVYTGAVEFNLHIAAADDLTFKCRCECNRNVDVCDLDLDISCFQRSCVEFGNVRLNDQALWNFERIFVCDYRETKCDRTCSTCNDNRIKRCKCIYKCRYTFHGVFHQACCITRLNVAEDQGCSYCNGYNMYYTCNIFAQRDHTYVCTCFVAKFFTLINDTANQCNQDTL